ncbi:hypothetical protein IMX17_07435 [Serratia sp. X3]|uniref:hypothetical protein n=1 Tax=Serratia sp. X3 TaxID=2780495 RepID=UPI001874C222|nr:hypothetical protein [Serratia sp. X3]MBE4973227.1 hypothetical protein [Serratia sp. X3]
MVQRYNPDYVMHAARFAPFARENEHGEFVRFSDYESLALENAALKSAITGKAYIDFVTSNGWNPGMKTINGKFAGFMDAEIDFGCMAYDHAKKLIDAVETPATDAALAAIQAQGVEKAAAKLYGSGYVFEVLMRHAAELREAK